MSDNCYRIVTVSDPSTDVTISGTTRTVLVEATDTTTALVETVTTAIIQENVYTIIEVGTTVSTGGSSDTTVIYLPFTFASSSPQVLGSLNTGDIVMNCEVSIEIAFDDPVAQISVGTPAAPNGVMSTAGIDATASYTYGTDENYIATTPETLNLYLSPGSSIMGTGYVLLVIKR